jgi:plasmid replication initiation protein
MTISGSKFLYQKMKFNENRSLYVVSSNDLIRAKYSYTLWEKRVFLYMISRLKREEKVFPMMRIYVKDLMKFFDSKSRDDYRAIRQIPESITKKPFFIPYRTESGERRWMFVNVLSVGTQPDPDEVREEAYIELKFNQDLVPHLLELREKFTKYDIRSIGELQSVYSIRMYEFIKENEFKLNGFEVSLDELKEMLYMKARDNDGVEVYPLYGDFKKRVLLKAQEDLHQYCDTSFEFEELKEGKRVVAFYFRAVPTKLAQKPMERKVKTGKVEKTDKVKTKPPTVPVAPDEASLPKDWADKLLELGIDKTVVQLLTETQEATRIAKGLDYTLYAFRAGKVRENVAGFLVNAIRKGYTDEAFEKELKQQQKVAEQQTRKANQAQWKKQLADMEAEHQSKIFDIIRDITAADSRITEEAIAAIKTEYAYFFKVKNMDTATLTVENFRQDVVLRGLVVKQIQVMRPQDFEAVNKIYLPKINELKNLLAI